MLPVSMTQCEDICYLRHTSMVSGPGWCGLFTELVLVQWMFIFLLATSCPGMLCICTWSLYLCTTVQHVSGVKCVPS